MFQTIARTSYRRRRLVLIGWVVGFLVMVVVGNVFKGPDSMDFTTPGAESTTAQKLLEAKFPARAGDAVTVAFGADTGVDQPAVATRPTAVLDQLRGEPLVTSVSPLTFSADHTVAYAAVQLSVQTLKFPDAEAARFLDIADGAGGNGLQVAMSGGPVEKGQGGGSSTEAVGILAAVVILLLAFGSVLAMGLPIVCALAGIGVGLAIVGLLAHVLPVPGFAPLIASMIGIGVGIDYALFIVTRYRQELAAGADPEDATVTALATSGRAVLFAGGTVVVSLLGLLVLNLGSVRGMAVGAAASVLMTMAAALTLLPAFLGFAGHSIDRLRVPGTRRQQGDGHRGFWFRWSRLVQQRPAIAATAGAGALLVLALPALSLHLGFPDDSTQPHDTSAYEAYALLAKGFGPGYGAPLILAVEGTDGAASARLVEGLRSTPGVAQVSPAQPSPGGDVATIAVVPTTGAQDPATASLVNRLRGSVIPAAVAGSDLHVYVGGANAATIDGARYLAGRLPGFIAVVAGLSILLLLVVFRSVVVAVKAAVMNLLSIAAAYGVVVAVFEWGWLKNLFGITGTAPITSFIPVMMFAILFGLSMDYEVFLLSRIREEYLRTGDNGLAVADGLAATARVITAAAAIMVSIFVSFVFGPQLPAKQIGLGLAAAILVDATLVRMVLVPATMELLGNANWWLPGWLDRLLPEGRAFEAAPGGAQPAPSELVASR